MATLWATSDVITAAKLNKSFNSGLDADKGTPSVIGEAYLATDTNKLYYSLNGTTWGYVIETVAGLDTHAGANVSASVHPNATRLASGEYFSLGTVVFQLKCPQTVATSDHTKVKLQDGTTDFVCLFGLSGAQRPAAPDGFEVRLRLWGHGCAYDGTGYLMVELYNDTDAVQVAELATVIYNRPVIQNSHLFVPPTPHDSKYYSIKMWRTSGTATQTLYNVWLEWVAVKA